MKGKRREPTQQLIEPWPFLYTIVPGRGLVVNVPPKARRCAKRRRKQEDRT